MVVSVCGKEIVETSLFIYLIANRFSFIIYLIFHMHDRLPRSLQQAYKEIPDAWYEHISVPVAAFTLMGLVDIALVLHVTDKPAYHLVGAGLYILSALADEVSTSKRYHAIDKARANHIPMLEEHTPFRAYTHWKAI